jgi:hypothetical protein
MQVDLNPALALLSMPARLAPERWRTSSSLGTATPGHSV